MSNTIQHKNNPGEEVDLGQLFKIIGNGFNKLFNFIGFLLTAVFDALVRFILFIRRHFIKFAVAALIGGVAGFILDKKQDVVYGADLMVKPNFGSTRQLYNNIQYYNNLVAENDTLLLAKTFNITTAEAASLQSFYISPLKNENSTLEAYNRLLNSTLDSAAIEKHTYEDFKKNISDYDYDTHNIQVTSLKNDIFRKLQPVIIASVKENSYFNTRMRITLENLDRSNVVLNNSMAEIDSLRNVYMDVLLAKAEKENPQGGTSIVLSENKTKINDIELFNAKIRFKNELNNNDIQRAENSQVINIISDFQPVGYRLNILYKKYYFVFGIAGVALIFLYLLIREFNAFLDAYQNKPEE
ncbi:MAG: hypothetical protein KDD04_01775 [Sinomicrobium sp.]|nr:hypothetical protein [Sinomicrobium sp.]